MFQYTNRKGVTYYLHASTGRGGKVRYTMKRTAEGALGDRAHTCARSVWRLGSCSGEV